MSGNNPTCRDDTKEFEAMRKDASNQRKLTIFERARQDTVTFRKILADYRERCAIGKINKGWDRPPYDFSRIREIVSNAQVASKGRR